MKINNQRQSARKITHRPRDDQDRIQKARVSAGSEMRFGRRRPILWLCCWTVCCAATPVDKSLADESRAPGAAALDANRAAAVRQITESRVLSAVSFLASDELAGRNTPSSQLNIAASYVAARFRGAGLEPLGDDESYYQTDQILAIQGPAEDARLVVGGTTDPVLAKVLLPAAQPVDLQAKVIPEDQLLQSEEPRVALLNEVALPIRGKSSLSFVLAYLQRRITAMAELGVQAVVMKTRPDSEWFELAERLRQNPVVPREPLALNCPLVLIPDTVDPGAGEVRLMIPPTRTVQHEVRNVVGIVRGSDPKLRQKAIVVSAHLDHIGTTDRGADRINNGADDNASGVTAVISLADAFAALDPPPPVSIIFVTFWGEEQGMKGSRFFVDNSPWPLSDVIANVNIEMVGRPAKDARNKAWMTGWKHSNLGELLNQGAASVGVEVFHREDLSEMLYTRSDNVSFVRRGVIAHSISAGSLHADYHQPSDEWQKLDIPHMTNVIRGTFAGILHLANHHDRLRKL